MHYHRALPITERGQKMSKHIITDKTTGEKKCTCFKRCGGCQLDMPYKQQLEWKQSKADRMLSGFCRVEPIIPMQYPYNYRNKVQTVYRISGSGQIISGVYQSSTRTLTAVDDCMIEDKTAAGIVSELKKLFVSFRIFPYNEKTGRGLLRHTLIRTAKSTGQIMVVLVMASPVFPSKKNFVNALVRSCPGITTVVRNINPDGMPLTLGGRSEVLYGRGTIVDELCGCKFIISPESFYQVNPMQTRKLYEAAVNSADVKEGTRVIDAYCGVGTIGMICARRGASVTAVESNPNAVRDAIANAKLNKLSNIRFHNADATQFLCELAQNGETADVVILDPPRAGSTPGFIEAVGKLSPESVVYVSCRIETLERDIKLFSKQGYRAVQVQPVDMFPHTTGIENTVLLKKRKKGEN